MMKSMHGRIDLLTSEQMDWCNEHCDFTWFVKDDGKIYPKDKRIYFKNENSIVSFLVEFGDCKIFDCYGCDSLKSLKGSPKNIDDFFSCSYCKSLVSLEGVPENIGEDFYCYYCNSLESIDGLKNIKIGKEIYHENCPKLEKYDPILDDMNVFRMWQRSACSTDEFLKEYDGFIEAKKYGI